MTDNSSGQPEQSEGGARQRATLGSGPRIMGPPLAAIVALAGTLGSVWLGGVLSSESRAEQLSRQQRETAYF